MADARRRAVAALECLDNQYEPMSGTHRWLAHLWDELGEQDSANLARERAEQIEVRTALDCYMCAEAAINLQGQDFVQALQYFEQALQMKPDHFLSLVNAAQAFGQMGEDEAEAAMATAAAVVQPCSHRPA